MSDEDGAFGIAVRQRFDALNRRIAELEAALARCTCGGAA